MDTRAVLQHHLEAKTSRNVEEVLTDYTEESVLFTPDGPMRGIWLLRPFYTNLFDSTPSEFWDAFQVLRQDVQDESAYIVWRAEPRVPLGTETFLIRDGKIAVQSFTTYQVV
jgi:hypothetical protein